MSADAHKMRPLLLSARSADELLDARSRMCSLPSPLSTAKLAWGEPPRAEKVEDVEQCLAFLCHVVHSTGLLELAPALTRDRLRKSLASLSGQTRAVFSHIFVYLLRTRNHKL